MQKQETHLDNLVLITGGAKSGKSVLAEQLAGETNSNVFYLATMPRIADDKELESKIEAHRKRRPKDWHTVEVSLELERAIDKISNQNSVCIIDCLSAYVSNFMLSQKNLDVHGDKLVNELQTCMDKLIKSIEKKDMVQFIIVTNEVGWSIVPENNYGRTFRELLGIANQVTAQISNSVYLCCSGITMRIKSNGKTVLV